jgi:hypothetical protein
LSRRTGFALVLLLSAAASAERTRVTLVTQGDSARASDFQASLGELLARLQLQLDVRGDADAGAPEGEALAAIEADFSEPDACKLTVIDWLGRTVLVRRLQRAASAELQAEAAAHVVQSVVEELIVQARWKPPVVEPPPLDAPPLETVAPVETTPAPEPGGPLGLDVGAFFGASSYFNGATVIFGGGATVSLALEVGRFRPMVTLLGEYHGAFGEAPKDASGNPISLFLVEVQTAAARALFSLDVLRGDAFRIDVGLGGGADIFWTKSTSQTLPAPWLQQRTDADPVVTLMVAGRLAVASSVDLYLAVLLDADVWPLQLMTMARHEQTPAVFYSVFPVRPALALGFSFNTFGRDPYGGGR